MQLNVISSSKHQHTVVSALTHDYYMAMTFHCMCRFSLSFIFHLHSLHHFFLFFILCAHFSHILLSPVISLPSHLLANPINIPLPFPSSFCSCQNSSLTPYLPIIYPFCTFISFPTFYIISFFTHFFPLHIIFPFPSFPPFGYVKYSLAHL